MKGLICSLVFIVSLSGSTVAQSLNADSLITIWRGAAEDTTRVVLSRMIAGTLRLTKPAEGIGYGRYGAALGKKLQFDKGTAGCYLNISSCYNALGKIDSALAYIDTAIYYSIKAGDANRLSLVYLNRADFYMQLQYFEQSLRNCDTALMYAEKVNSDDRRARVLQTFGSIYFFQESYDQSEQYYVRANELYRKINNQVMSAIVQNNLALVNKNTGRYDAAAGYIRKSINIAYELEDHSNLGMYYQTLGEISFRQQNYTDALRYTDSSLRYGLLMKNDVTIGNAWESQGQVYARQGKQREAITALTNSYNLFKQMGDVGKTGSTAGLLAEVYTDAGDFKKAFGFQQISHATADTLAQRRYQGEITAMQTRFKVDEKDQAIQLLGKNRQLQEQQLRQQRTLLLALAALALFVLAAAALLISRNRHRQQVRELKLRNSIAADLHDEVGSSLSSIHMLSELVQPDAGSGKAEVMDRIHSYAKETMEKMGDIVWMIKPVEQQEMALKDRMLDFLRDVCESRNIDWRFEADELDHFKLSLEQRKAIYLIFKETVNNAAKYSQARNIQVSFTASGGRLQLTIQDDGIGFDTSGTSRGNGLMNMQNRAKEIGGYALIESGKGAGTKIVCSIPV